MLLHICGSGSHAASEALPLLTTSTCSCESSSDDSYLIQADICNQTPLPAFPGTSLSQLSTRTLLFNQCFWHTTSLLLWLCDAFDLFEKSENPLIRTSVGSKGELPG